LAGGCSKDSIGTANRQQPRQSIPTAAAALGWPAELRLVETAENKERSQIKAESLALLTAGQYDTLDSLARTHRASKECYADGLWKLKEVYAGLVPAENSSETQWQARLTAIREWSKAKPASITARVALADTLVSYAWKARGSGYADTVTQNGWKLFEGRLAEAVQVLKDSKALKETCPRWWSIMLTTALASGVDKATYQTLFAEALKAAGQRRLLFPNGLLLVATLARKPQ
jgi:hypothetical protein